MYQTTITRKVDISGVGLHSGLDAHVTIYPAYQDTGIIFKKNLKNKVVNIKANPFNVVSTHLSTTINSEGYNVGTVEHLMSALYGLGIDNAIIEIDGNEIPILDGSSFNIVEQIQNAEIKYLSKKRKYLKINKKIRVEKGDKWIEIIPSRFFKVTFQIDFDNKYVKTQKAFFNITPDNYTNHIAKARTFGFKEDIENLWKMGLAKGGSIENALVVDGDRVINPGGLRYDDEFVRHKILDLVGDISLVGYRLFGHIRAYKAGHELNNHFARTLLESDKCYTLLEIEAGDKEKGFDVSVPNPQATI